VPDGEEPLVLYGREFEGFTRALDEQFRLLPDLRAVHRLIEISSLERLVVEGDGASSGAIDVLMLNTDWLPNLIARRWLRPLDRCLGERPPAGWPDAWVESLRSLQTGPDGRVYGLAYHDGPVMLLYRTDLYQDPAEQRGFTAKFGYDLRPARTWDEFLDQAAWFTRPSEGLYGTILAGYPDEHNNIYDFLTQLWSRGGELLTPGGDSGLDSTAARNGLTFLRDLWHTHRVMPPEAAGWDSVASGIHFAAGDAAMMVNWCGFAALSSDPSSPTHGLVGCAPAPAGTGPGGTRATMNSYWVLSIPVGCRRPGRAYELIQRLAEPAMDVITARSGGTATRRDTWALPETQSLAPYYASLASAHQSARVIPRDPDWPAMARMLNEFMRAVVENGAGLEALGATHTMLQEFLDQRRARRAAAT
jgi:multiple sugar transport system substrate-binding protein